MYVTSARFVGGGGDVSPLWALQSQWFQLTPSGLVKTVAMDPTADGPPLVSPQIEPGTWPIVVVLTLVTCEVSPEVVDRLSSETD